MAYFVLFQAQKDIETDTSWIPDTRGGKERLKEAKFDKKDAIDFLYSERLEMYIESFALDANPDWIRRITDGDF